MPRRKQQAPKRLKGSGEGGEEECDGDNKQEASSPDSAPSQQPTSPKPATSDSDDTPQSRKPDEQAASSPKSPQREPKPHDDDTVTSDGKRSPPVSPQHPLSSPVDAKIESDAKPNCCPPSVVVPTPKRELPVEQAMISTRNEHIEKLKETLNFNLMKSKWRENVIKTKHPLDSLSAMSGTSKHLSALDSFTKRRAPPDTVQRLPESMRGESFRESMQSRRVSDSSSVSSERPPRDSHHSKRPLGSHPTEIPLKKHHKMPPSRPAYDSDSDSEEEYRHRIFRGFDRKMFSHPMFASSAPPPPPAPPRPASSQAEALDLRVKKKSKHSTEGGENMDTLLLTTKIERHDDNCSKCESGSSQYVHNKLVKTVFCEAVPRDVLASVSRLQTDYSVLPSRVNLCRAVNGRCNFVVCTDCYQAFPNVGMLSLHLIATGHSSTKQINTEALLQRGYLALVPPRTEFFSTCALRRKQRTPTTGGRKEVCVYTCSVCSLSFPDFLDFTVHLTTSGHDKTDKVPKPPRKISASDYPEEIPVNQVMKCLICQSSFRTLKDLTMHMVRTKHYSHVPVHDSVLYSKLGSKDDYRIEEDEDMCIDNAADREDPISSRPPITHPSLSPTARSFRHHRREDRHHHRSDKDHKQSEHHHPHRSEHHHPHRMEVEHKMEKHPKEQRLVRDDRSSREDRHHHKEDKHRHRLSLWQEEAARMQHHKEPKHHSPPHPKHQSPPHPKHQSPPHPKHQSPPHPKHQSPPHPKHQSPPPPATKDDKKVPSSEDGSASTNTKQVLNQMLASKRRSPKSHEEDSHLKGLGKKSRSLKCIGCEHLFADVPKLSKHMKETGHYMIPPGPDDVDQRIMHTSSLSTPNGKYSHIKMASSIAKQQLADSKTKGKDIADSKTKGKDIADEDVVVKMEDYFADDSDDEDDLFQRNDKPEVEKLQEKVDSMFNDSAGEKDTASSTSSAPVVECVGKYVDPDNFDVVFPTGSRIVGSSLGSNPLGSLASMVETAKEMNFSRTAFTANSDRWFRRSGDDPGCSIAAASEDTYKTAAAAAAATAVAAAAAEAARSAAARAAAAARSSTLVSAAASYPTSISPASTMNTMAIKKEWDDAKILAKCAKKHQEDGLSNVTVAEAIKKILSSSFNFIKDEEKSTFLKEERNASKRRKQSSSSDAASLKRKEEDVQKMDERGDELASREKQDDDSAEKDCEIKDTDSRTESQSSTPCPMEQEDIVEKRDDKEGDKMDKSPVTATVVHSAPTRTSRRSSESDSQEDMSTEEPMSNSNNDIEKAKERHHTPEPVQQVSVLCENRRVTRSKTAKFMSSTENGDCRKSPLARPIAALTTSIPEPKETSPSPSPKSNHSQEMTSETEAEQGVRIKRELQTSSPLQNGAKSPELQSHTDISKPISPYSGNDSNHSISSHGRKSPANHRESSLLNHHHSASPHHPSSPPNHHQASPTNNHHSSPSSPAQPKDAVCLPPKIKIKQEPRDDTPSPNHYHRLSASPSKPLNNNNPEIYHHSPHIKGPASSLPLSRTSKYSSFINSIPSKYNCASPFSSSNSNPLQDLDKLVNNTTTTIQSPALPKIAKFSAEVFGRRYVKRQQDLYINPSASENHVNTNPLEEMDKMVNATKEQF